MSRYFYAALTCLCTLTISAHAESVAWKDDVRGWMIRVDPTIGNGCFMLTEYDGGTYLRVQFNPSTDNLDFIIGDGDWRSVEKGKLYELSVQFGNRTPWAGDAEGFWFGDNTPALMMSVPFHDDRAKSFMEEFMRMSDVRVKYEGSEIAHLSLSGTYAAMQEAIACQIAMAEEEDDPFATGSGKKEDPFR